MTDQEKIATLQEALQALASVAFHANMNAAFTGTQEPIDPTELDRACAALSITEPRWVDRARPK